MASTGYWMVVPQDAAAPTAAQIKAGADYGGVVVAARGSGAMAANVEQAFQLTGLSAATNYDLYFVSEDDVPAFSDVYKTSFTTNALPTISVIANQTTCQDVATPAVGFVVGDTETAAGDLTVSAVSSNTALVPNSNIVLGGSGENRTIAVTPAEGQYGSTTVTVTVTDAAGETAERTFTVTVNANNTAAPAVQNVTYRVGDAAAALSAQATGSNLLWYATAAGGAGSATAPTPSTTSTGIQEFWVTQTLTACESGRSKITVTIIPANSTPTNITLSSSSIDENMPASSVVGTLSTTDADQGDSHAYALVSGEGAADNTSFDIDGNILKLKISPDYETKSTYSIRVKTDDGNGGSFEKAFTITVNDLDEVAPALVSILRQTPTAATTNAVTLTYRVTFTEPVNGVGVGRFELSKTGTANGVISAVTNSAPTVYDVTVTQAAGDGEIALNLKNNGAGIVDLAGNAFVFGSHQLEAFLLDNTAPVVNGVETNVHYNSDVTVSFNEGTAKLNGNAFTNGTAVSAEGIYTLVVNDAATNATSVTFTIDKTNPIVTGVANNGKYNTDRIISFNEGMATLNGSPFMSGTLVGEEGAYTLIVIDAATNTTNLDFVVDKTSPTGTLAINNGAGFVNTREVTLKLTAADAGGTGVTEIRFFNTDGEPSAWEPVATTKAWMLSNGEGLKTVHAELKDDAGNIALLNASITYETVRPTVVVSSEVPAATKAAFNVTFTFSEGVNEFTVEDITVENGEASAFTNVSSEVYTAFITPATEGAVKVSVAAGKAVDPALNGNFASNEIATNYDVTTPTVELNSIAAEHVNTPFTVTFSFSEPVSGFTLDDVVVTNGAAAHFENASSQVYTAVITPATDGEVQVSVAANVALDAATNGNEASAILTRIFDATQPEVVVATAVSTPTNVPFAVTFTFTEEVSGFEASDVTVTNGTAADFIKVSGKEYSAVITPAADGEVTVSVAQGVAQDIATSGNKASNQLKLVYDATRPVVTVATAAANPSNTAFSVTFHFSEEVSGFEAEDVIVINGELSGFNKQSALVYTATVTPTNDGEVKISVAENMAVDAATNGNLASNEVMILYDVAKPTVALSTPVAEVINAPFTVTFTFSEPVTGFVQNKISVVNATVTELTAASSSVYTALVTPTTDGEVTVTVGANVALDAAANGNEASAILSRTYDATMPTVILATTAADPTNVPFMVTFSFNEDVYGFELGDIAVANGAASEFTKVDGQTYTALVTPAADGNVLVKLAAGVASDKATNPSEASAELSRLYDATEPAGYMIAFNADLVDVTNVTNMSLSITGAEVGATYNYTITSSNGGTQVTGTAQVQQAGFELSGLDLTDLNDGTLTATLYLVDAAGNKGADATAEVTKITRDIVAVTVPEVIKVPIRTTYANVPVPSMVEVTYSTGAKEQISINWSQGNYNGLLAGAYELTGELVLTPMTTNLTQQFGRLTVEVQPNKVPTALAFSATTFKPEATADDEIGAFATTDPDDTEFVYSLVSGDGSKDNELFELRGDKLHLKSNKGLSGITQLSIRVRSTDPYQNIIEKSFTLSKELYAKPESQLKIVNAFSPDGDGINDTWTIPELRFYNNVEIEVFDRSGVRLFHTTNPEEGWNGKDANGQIRKGAFFYIVQVKDINMVKKGVVTILKK